MKNILTVQIEIHFDTRSVGKSFTSTLLGIAIRDRIHKSETQIMKIYNLKSFKTICIKDSITLKV
jgi:hypothetical protein